MTTISLCIVAGNETEQLVNILESLKNTVDEIVIVHIDSGEGIRRTCSTYTNRIFHYTGSDDLAMCRNYSFSMATKEHLFWLDPSESISEDQRQKLIGLKERLDASVDAVKMIQAYTGFDRKISVIAARPRIVKRDKFFQWHSGLEGYLPVTGNIINSDIVIERLQTGYGFSVYEQRLENGEKLTPKELYYYAEKLFEKNNELSMEYYKQFLREKDGWTGDKLRACERLAEFYRQRQDREKEFRYTLKSFEFDLPRAEFLCRLGVIFTELKESSKSIFWYNMALTAEKPKDHLGYMREEYWTWVPHLKLAGCYFRTGEYEKAYLHNEAAIGYKQGDANLLYNKSLIEGMLKTSQAASDKTKKRLRIIQVAPDIYPVPPKDYGGIESIIFEITEELVKRGHEVILYALPGSKTNARLMPYQHGGKGNFNAIAEYVLKTMPKDVDIIHDHTHISVLGKRNLATPTVCTIHGTIGYRLDYPTFVSERALEVIGHGHGFYVYNGLNLKDYEFCEEKDDYMLYLGRLDKYKGIEHALDIAERTGKKLVIAGPVHDREYYSRIVEPRINHNPNIKYIGSVGGKEKQHILKKASCLLFPTCWEEPFGLVMIEAMACGTPVIALANGAVPEVLKGFPDCICHSTDEMVQRLQSVEYPDPGELRKYVIDNFTTEKMVDGYLNVYDRVIADKKKGQNHSVSIHTGREKPLRIVQVSPDALPVPPKDYGGIERVVFDITEELVRKGHEVYLFAPEGSRTGAKLITYEHKGSDVKKVGQFVKENLPEKIDIIHDHTHSSVMDQLGLSIPVVSTIHDSRKNTAKNPVYLCRKALQNVGLNQGFYVYNGINPDDYEFSEHKEDYLIFMGLLYAHKGIKYALEVAEKTGRRLLVAGPIYNMEYYKNEIEPRMKKYSNITYVGSIGGKERQNLLKNARCMLFPTVWEEPFGLVMVEAMACGTPVLAFGNGAVPEVLAGFPELICKDVDEMAFKVDKNQFPHPKILRTYVQNEFSAVRMTEAYLEIYRKRIKKT